MHGAFGNNSGFKRRPGRGFCMPLSQNIRQGQHDRDNKEDRHKVNSQGPDRHCFAPADISSLEPAMISRRLSVRSFAKTIAKLLGPDATQLGSIYSDIFLAYEQ